MKAALKNADGTFRIAEVERPSLPDSNFVLARVRVAGICGTDLRHWKKHEPDLECHITGITHPSVSTKSTKPSTLHRINRIAAQFSWRFR